MFNLDDIESWEYVDESTVYDIEVQDCHNYYLDTGCEVLVHNSGKTYSILQVLMCILAQQPGKVATIVGRDIPNLKVGAIRDFEAIWHSEHEGIRYFEPIIASYNKTDNKAIFANGSVLEFKSFDDKHDAQGSRRDYLFINEANGIPYPIADQLMIRTRVRTFIDYNPTAPFWVHDEIMGKVERSKYTYIQSTYKNNPFLEDKIIKEIESKEFTDPYWFTVYGRGELGRLEGAVYTNWEAVDNIPDGAKFIGYGLDFGFSVDPAAMVGLWRYDSEIYVEQLIYETGLTNQDIAQRLEEMEIRTDGIIWADSAEPKSIEEIARAGYRIKPTSKGADSVRVGIDLLKQFKLNVVRSAVDVTKELQLYQWATDRFGKALNKPVDKHNHAMDAMRYAALMTLSNKKGVRYFGTL